MTTTNQLALLMFASIRSALANGVEHRAKDGRLLRTEREILQALLDDGEILIGWSEGYAAETR
jgi:hypothetical protein